MKRILSILIVVAMTLGVCGFAAAESTTDGKDVTTLTMFVDAPWWPYSDWSGEMPQWATQQTGVKFDVTIAADYNELALKVASGDLPDVVVTDNFNLMSNADLCYSWDDLIGQYGLTTKLHPAYDYVNQASDGKTYTTMVGWSADYEYKQYPEVNPEGRAACIRDDIAQKVYSELGITSIKTLADLEGAFDICKRDYPDVLPYAFCGDWPLDYYVGELFGCAEAGFVDEGDGYARLWIDQACRKDAYMKLNEWARKGYISKETYAWSNISTGGEWCTAGDLFCYALSDSNATSQDSNSAAAGAPYTWTELTDLYTDNIAYYQYRAGWRGYFITKNCSNPEAAIKYAMFAVDKPTQYTMMWGIEGRDWNWNADKTVANFNYDINKDTDYVAKLQLRWGWLGHDGISNNMYTVAKGGKTALGKAWVGSITKWQPVMGIIMHSMDPDGDMYTEYNDMVQLEKDSALDIIFSDTEEEASAKYDEMIAKAADMGSQDIEKWANTLYPDLLAGYNAVKDIGPEGWK